MLMDNEILCRLSNLFAGIWVWSMIIPTFLECCNK